MKIFGYRAWCPECGEFVAGVWVKDLTPPEVAEWVLDKHERGFNVERVMLPGMSITACNCNGGKR